MKDKKKKLPVILFAFYSNHEYDSIALNAIDVLSNEFCIEIVVRNQGKFVYSYKNPENILIHKIGSWIEIGHYHKSRLKMFFDYIFYIFAICKIKKNVSLMICYDMAAFVTGSIANYYSKKKPLLYYQNETELLGEIKPFTFRYLAKLLEIYFTPKSDLLCFPEPNRAKYFFEYAKLKKDFLIVENCPLKFKGIPKLHPEMLELRKNGYYIIFHRGPFGLGTEVDIYPLIQSIKYWPKNSLFVNVGIYKQDELEACLKIAEEEKVLDRVHFIQYVQNPEEMYQYIASADIGLILYKPESVNRKYVAPGKLYSYMACGIPVVVPSALPHISKMVSELEIGFNYSESTPESIGMTISKLLNYPGRKAMGEKARKEHLSRLNFETQFQPVLDRINNAIERTRI